MLTVNPAGIPEDLQQVAQWVLWRVVERDGHVTKLPYQINGLMAKSNDPETWATYEQAISRYLLGAWDGIGFVFSDEDPYCGVDLDGCRNPETGMVVPWAKKLILEFATYAEVSPSGTGVKMWVRGGWPFDGHKQILADVERVSDKTPAVEVYDSVRYFAVTGHVLRGQTKIADGQPQLELLRRQFWPSVTPKMVANKDWRSIDSVMDRAAKYLAKMPVSVSGQDGSGACFRAACVLVCGFGLSDQETLSLLSEWNSGCLPPWSERELRHKIDGARNTPGEKGYLRDVSEKNYDRVPMHEYRPPKQDKPKPEVRVNSVKTATAKFFERVRRGDENLIELGLPELDFAIGGGVEAGEMVLLAARPSHGKSAVAMQFVHHWTLHGRPSLFVSEEMSEIALARRTIQFASNVHKDHWRNRIDEVERQTMAHLAIRAECLIIEGCRTAETAAEEIRKAKKSHNIECVVVDYAQLLGSKGNGLYEQNTQTSICLRQVTSETKVVLIALCQMSRTIEKRDKFIPMMSDIKGTGQFEQDADVVVFGVWPHRINSNHPANEYQFHVVKNRNREISMPLVNCNFDPTRQTFSEVKQGIPFEPPGGYFAECSKRDADGF